MHRLSIVHNVKDLHMYCQKKDNILTTRNDTGQQQNIFAHRNHSYVYTINIVNVQTCKFVLT